jgi:hypothetical protein
MCLLQRITLYALYGMSEGSTEQLCAHRPTLSGNSDVRSAQNVTEGDGLARTNHQKRLVATPVPCEPSVPSSWNVVFVNNILRNRFERIP